MTMPAADTRALSDLLQPGATLMVGTDGDGPVDAPGRPSPASGAGGWAFRPLTVARVDGHVIDILLDTREEWAHRFHDGDPIHVTYSDTRSNDWVDLRATGTVSRDPALIDELWNPFAGAYFDDGRDTPGIAVLRITVESGRYWSTPSGRVGSLISMLTAADGHPQRSAEHGPVGA